MRLTGGFLTFAFAALLFGSACGPVDSPVERNVQVQAQSSCAADDDCGRGMVCEACPDGAMACVPGCRTTDQCPANMVCLPGVRCLSCPCPPGWCELDPCRDLDGDGYVFTTDPNIACPGKDKGDCNDGNARIHPGAREYCADWIDNDCDGNVDTRDSDCQQCTTAEDRCNSPADCGLGNGRTCDRGCCTACPAVQQPDCEGACVLPGGVDPLTGCALAPVCGACASCSTAVQKVCGTNYATYTNACHAAAAGVDVLHSGACVTGEGLSCTDASPGALDACFSGTWCRDLCPPGQVCPVKDHRCTRVGTCVIDADCPAGIGATPVCPDRSVAPLACENHRCVAKCP